jgi:hypothetical protein
MPHIDWLGRKDAVEQEIAERTEAGRAGNPKSEIRNPKVRAGLAIPKEAMAKGGKTVPGKLLRRLGTIWTIAVQRQT